MKLQLRERISTIFTAGDLVITVLMLYLLCYYVSTRGIFEGKASGDGYQGFLYLPGILFHHTLDIAPVSAEWAHRLGREATGHVANACPIGPVILWAPTYLFGLLLKKTFLILHGLHLLPRAIWTRLPLTPLHVYGPFDFFMAGLGAFFSGVCGIALSFKLLRRRLSLLASRYAVVTAILATPITWYLVTQPLYQHACAFFAVTLFIERWDAYRDALSWRRALILGALAGFAMLMRLQEAIILALPGMDIAIALFKARRDPRAALSLTGRGVTILIVAFIVFLPQLLIWKYYFGSFRTPQAAGHMRWSDPALIETLFSTRAGLVPWIPALYIALPGLLLCGRLLKGLALPLSILFLLDFYVNSCAWDFHGSWAFGPRRFTDMTVVIAAGLGAAFSRIAENPGRFTKLRRGVLCVVTALLILWNGLLMELMRQRKTKSSSAGAYPASTWVEWAKGPKWLVRTFERVGFPFVQPVAWIYGAIYHMPSAAFEGIVGNYILERDWRIRSFILTPSIPFGRQQQSYVIEGTPRQPWHDRNDGPSQVVVSGSTVRLILPFSAVERVTFELLGDLKGKESQLGITWNGVAMQPLFSPGRVRVVVPKHLVHHRGRLNELIFSNVPPGSALSELLFYSSTAWWQ